jgi:septum formation protein
LGLVFEVRPPNIDETPRPDESPSTYVLRLAESKATAAAETGDGNETVLAADTIVVLDGELLGQPRDEADARRMLTNLSGRQHHVLTGVALCHLGRSLRVAAVESTKVTFTQLSEREVAWYASSGEPMDKAGAYAVQGLGAVFVERLEGNYSNVVGLPLPLTCRLLRRVGYPLPFEGSA